MHDEPATVQTIGAKFGTFPFVHDELVGLVAALADAVRPDLRRLHCRKRACVTYALVQKSDEECMSDDKMLTCPKRVQQLLQRSRSRNAKPASG